MKVWTCASLAALCVLGATAMPASAANVNTVSGTVRPAAAGSASKQVPIGVRFTLRSRNEDAANRPLPTKTYALAMEGVTTNARAFPACSIARLRARRGPPSACAKALLGTGLIKGAAGIVEDETMGESVPCNLRLRIYNMRSGIALRLDADPPLPRGFKSNRIGCPVPIHTAIPAPFRRTTIDGLRSTEFQFTVPKLLMRPLVGWNSGLMTVGVTVRRLVAKGKGYFAATGCNGDSRQLRVGFTGVDGARADATAETRC